MDQSDIRRMIFEGRGVVEIGEMRPEFSEKRIREIRLEMIGEGLPICSPFGLVQERVARGELHEWRVAVVCCLMNRTHARQVRPMMAELFARWPSPADMELSGQELEQVLQPLGLISRRARALRSMSHDYVNGILIDRCFAVGEYGQHSLRIFVRGEYDFEPTDKFLVRYVDWVKEGKIT